MSNDNSRDEWDAMAEVTRRPLPIPAERGEVDALLAEVERLRGEVSYLRACVPPTRPTDYGHEVWTAALRAEVAAERAAVVAWLRDEVDDDDNSEGPLACILAYAANAIECGEHRREEEK